MTAKGSTKQEILDAALELFSVQGYEATSISQLAEAVGIRKASLYSHFENKQAILDALMQATLEQYEQHSIFAKADWGDPAFTKDKENMTPDMAVQLCLPVSVWLNLCDREPEREAEVTRLIERHIRQFFDVYRAK